MEDRFVTLPRKGTLVLEGREFPITPLKLPELQRLDRIIEQFKAGDGKSSLDLIVECAELIHASVARCDPKVTRDEIVGLLDLTNWEEAWTKVAELSGLKRPQGEPKPAADSASTGSSSTV